jgi:hypothetical protein
LTALLILDDDPCRDRVVGELFTIPIGGVIAGRRNHLGEGPGGEGQRQNDDNFLDFLAVRRLTDAGWRSIRSING